jgi:two-component system nitrogen regulation response regulator GlnG
MNKVWIVDDDQSIRWVLEKALAREKLSAKSFSNPNDVLDALEKDQPQVIISDIRMPRGSGINLLQQIKAEYPKVPVIIMTAYSDLDSAVAAFQGGAFEYLTKPFDIQDAMELIHRAIGESQGANQAKSPYGDGNQIVQVAEMIGQAPAMQEVFRAIGRLSQSNATVLITGESGTGKELVARALHRHSARAKGPFVALNLASIPHDLLESELFGHERGAFPAAQTLRRGRFEQADGGTLFLDEIGDLPLNVQSTLLRVLEDGQFYRLGGQDLLRANVRVIASTHHHLEARVAEGLFRDDLFHRLNVIRLRLPSLRERAEDIPLLAKYFLANSAKSLGVEPKVFSDEALEKLMHSALPGNVRQLQSICQWLTVMSSSKTISLGDLPKDLDQIMPIHKDVGMTNQVGIQAQAALPDTAASFASPAPFVQASTSGWEQTLGLQAKKMLEDGKTDVFKELQDKFERAVIQAALDMTRGRKVEAAERLGIGRNTITRKLQELDIQD